MTDLREWKGKRVCAAVSGGVDSMTLLFLLHQQAEEKGFFLYALTCEHGLRGEESKEDVKLVQSYCQTLNVPLYCFFADCKREAEEKGISVETAAREFRLRCYEEILREKADVIATAHHENDEAETVLFRLARGASLTGASGMTKENARIVRPLLSYTKEKLYEIAKQNGVPYREDKTNFQTDYTRNKLRLEILPALEEAVHGAQSNLARFAYLAREDDEFLYRLAMPLVTFDNAKSETDGAYRVKTEKEKPLFSRACLYVLKKLGLKKDYTRTHLESLYRLQTLQTGSRIVLPGGIFALRKYDEIVFYKGTERKEQTDYIVHFSDEPFPVSDDREGKILRADKDKISSTAVVRTFRTGDEFRKFGGGNKPLKKYFIDKKILQEERGNLPLLAEKDGSRVYAVCGVEISEEIKTDERTTHTVYIKLTKEKKKEGTIYESEH